jgi:hypothetical protein
VNFGLSVLDVSPVSAGSNHAQALRSTLDLTRLADLLGYERYWLAEHDKLPSIASSAPEIMVGHVAGVVKPNSESRRADSNRFPVHYE